MVVKRRLMAYAYQVRIHGYELLYIYPCHFQINCLLII